MVSNRGPHDHVQWHQNLQSKQNGDGTTEHIPIVLSSTRQDLPINMQQCYEDALIILKKYGKSDYFIMMTCNPQNPQIAWKLTTCQTSLNMSHLVSCVLRQYLNLLSVTFGRMAFLAEALPGFMSSSYKNWVILKPTLY